MTKQSSFKDYLDQCIDIYYSNLISKYHFQVTRSYFEGLGALYEFESSSFKLKIVNDKGLINSEISSIYQPETYKDVDAFNSLIQLNKVEEASLDKWQIKMILTKTLSCEEEANFINSEYNKISEILNQNNYQKTLQELDKLQRKRFNYLFNTNGA
jgi:hypothetical protein